MLEDVIRDLLNTMGVGTESTVKDIVTDIQEHFREYGHKQTFGGNLCCTLEIIRDHVIRANRSESC